MEAFWAAGSARRYESPNALFGDGAMSDVRRVINIGRGQAPLAAAEVRKDRSECPENILPSKPARVEAATVPALLIGRNNGPASIPAASSHARSAFTAGLGATEIA